jgi:hypothetical protein
MSAMKLFVGVVAVASVALPMMRSGPTVAQTSTVPANPRIEIAYEPPTKNPNLVPIYQRLTDRKVLETLRQFLAPLQLPDKLVVKFDECGGNLVARHKHKGPATICYEYVADIERLAPRSTVLLQPGAVTYESAIVGPVVQAVLHEVAIAVFDMLELPVWGRVDDAADRVAAFIMLQFGDDVAWNTVVGFAWYLSGNALAAPDFSDERGVVAQRYYTTLCIGYAGEVRLKLGSNQHSLSDFVIRPGWNPGGGLPAERAAACLEEFDTVRQAFNDTIMQRVEGALLEQVRKFIKWSNLTAGK